MEEFFGSNKRWNIPFPDTELQEKMSLKVNYFKANDPNESTIPL